MVLCCFLSISECDFIVLLKSLINELWFFSRLVSLVFSLFMSARMDFGIPDVFGMAICSFDEKKSIPHGSETSAYRMKIPLLESSRLERLTRSQSLRIRKLG